MQSNISKYFPKSKNVLGQNGEIVAIKAIAGFSDRESLVAIVSWRNRGNLAWLGGYRRGDGARTNIVMIASRMIPVGKGKEGPDEKETALTPIRG